MKSPDDLPACVQILFPVTFSAAAFSDNAEIPSHVCCLATMLDFTNLGSGETTPSVTLSTLPNVPLIAIHDGG